MSKGGFLCSSLISSVLVVQFTSPSHLRHLMVNMLALTEMNLKANGTEVVQMVSTVALQQKHAGLESLKLIRIESADLDLTTY